MAVPVAVPGSKTIHLVAQRSQWDAWTHLPGWTFCGMEPRQTSKPLVGFVCQSCNDWADAIAKVAAGTKA